MLEINKIYCGDCQELMKELPDKSVDLVLTDPPYKIHAQSGGGFHRTRNWLRNIHEANLDVFNPEEFLNISKKKLKYFHAYIFTSKDLIHDYIHFIENNKYGWDIIILAKDNPIPTKNNKYLSDKEYLLFIRELGGKCTFNNDKPFDYYRSVKNFKVRKNINVYENFSHPTKKPIDVIEELIMISTNENDLILDPFIGSGTTAVACIRTNRNFIGMEISPEYCAIANKRIGYERQQLKLDLQNT